MSVVREEIFGPVLVAQRFDDLDEVAALANDTQYGLGASIWSNDLTAVHRLVPKIRAGTVWVNVHDSWTRTCRSEASSSPVSAASTDASASRCIRS